MIAVLAVTAAGDPPPEVAVCAGCHGVDGNSVSDTWPVLAGQPPAYIEKELWDFKLEVRSDPTMSGVAATLDAAAIDAVAAWFSSQTRIDRALPPDPKRVPAGEALYQRGDPGRGLAPCRACHGPDARGGQDRRGNAFPALAGQHPAYLEKQLTALAGGERANDPGGMMSLVASRLTPTDIDVLAAYLGRLPAGGP